MYMQEPLSQPCLFLDVDGIKKHFETPWFHPRSTANLKRIVEATNSRLILSSTWAGSASEESLRVAQLNAVLTRHGIQPVTDFTRKHAPPEESKLPLSIIRAREIAEWRQQGSRREASWAVLDDLKMSADDPINGSHPSCHELEDHLVNTCPQHGITEAHADCAIAMLNGADSISIVDATKLACPMCDEREAGVTLNAACIEVTKASKHDLADMSRIQPFNSDPVVAVADARTPSTPVCASLRFTLTAISTTHVAVRIWCGQPARRVTCSEVQSQAHHQSGGRGSSCGTYRDPRFSTACKDHAWRKGAQLVSASEPRLILYPNFLSDAETDHLLELARDGAAEAAASSSYTVAARSAVAWDGGRAAKTATSGQTISIHLPRQSDDAIIHAIEERCAAVTGIPTHPDEEPIGLRHTSPSTTIECAEGMVTALHVDTNQGGYHRAATVLLYLHEMQGSVGGETRFPLVGAAEHSELRCAAERLASMGTTAFTKSKDVEWPPVPPRLALMAAAEDAQVGFHVKPKRGLAAVFWTHTEDGLDCYSWHAGARLLPEATEGKLIAQKFKSLPTACRPKRRGEPVRLPAGMAPPAM